MSRHLASRALVVCLVGLAAFAGVAVVRPGVALAQGKAAAGAKKSIAVGVIEGPQGDSMRKKVLQTLKKTDSYEITDAEDLRPGSEKSAYAAMAQALQVEAIVVGKVTKGGDLTLSVIGPDGNLIEDVKLKGSDVDDQLEIAIAGPLGGKAAKAEKAKPKVEEEEPEDEEEATPGKKSDEDEDEEKPKEAPPPEPSKGGRRPLELVLGARLYNRAFVYSDLLYRQTASNGLLQPYKLAIAPAIIASGRVYPFAFTRDDALSNVGIMGSVELGIATSTNFQQPGNPPVVYKLNNGTSEWQVGLRGRLPLGDHELGFFGAYGAHAFVLAGDEGGPGKPAPLVPDVNYQFLRFGVDGRLEFSKLTIGAHFAPRFLTSLHQIDQAYFWFPGATGSGVDFGIYFAYQVMSILDIAVGGDALRYAFNFNGIPDSAGIPEAGTGLKPAPYVAGGASDTYISGWAGVIFHFDASASAGDGKASVEATAPAGDEE